MCAFVHGDCLGLTAARASPGGGSRSRKVVVEECSTVVN
jgi:hypothetical protein